MARADAPGRVNLIGEHTDYNDGLVFPAAIPQRVHVQLDPRRDDDTVHVESEGFPSVKYSLRGERRSGDGDHVRAVTWALLRSGHGIHGFDARIRSDIPAGAGLGSSAALAVALLRALRDAFSLSIDDRELALLAHEGEVEFVGARVGTMDQLAASLGRQGEALLIDTRATDIERIALPQTLALVVIDSGIAHDHASDAYNARRNECEEAARTMGISTLRDATDAGIAGLARTQPELAARARHVLTENARVRSFVSALRAGDLAACGVLLDASHRSLRDDFAVSLPEVDLLVALLRAQPGVFGARMVGGGFGGAVLAIATPDSASSAARTASAAYRSQTGREPRVLLNA